MKTAAMVINEMEVFPKDRYDDLTDSTTQAIRVFARQ
jgi:phage terminase large subunit-like protein